MKLHRRRSSLALAVFLTLLVASGARAQEQHFVYPTPAANTFVVSKDIAYAAFGGHDVLMDSYRPARGSRGPLPVMIFLNTNAGAAQRDHAIYTGWARAATAHGFVAILPDAATDVAAGFDALLAYLAGHAAELGVDADRVAVYAASGNVFTAYPLISNPARTRVKAAVLYYGSAPPAAFRSDLPILVVRAGLDRPGMNEYVDQFIAAAARANAPVSLINYPGGNHAFEMINDTGATRDVIERTFSFVTAALAPAARAGLLAGIPMAEAMAAVQRGDFARAAELYAPMVAARPDDANLRLSFGEALLGARRFKEARAQFEQLKDAHLGYRDLGIPAAKAAAADGDPEAAIAWLQSIPKRFRPASLRDEPEFAALAGRADFQELFR